MVVNCSGSNRNVSRLHVTKYHGIAGLGVIVCDVPDTKGSISRSSKNCTGNMGSMYLHSGQKYSRFAVKAIQFPSGITVHKNLRRRRARSSLEPGPAFTTGGRARRCTPSCLPNRTG